MLRQTNLTVEIVPPFLSVVSDCLFVRWSDFRHGDWQQGQVHGGLVMVDLLVIVGSEMKILISSDI